MREDAKLIVQHEIGSPQPYGFGRFLLVIASPGDHLVVLTILVHLASDLGHGRLFLAASRRIRSKRRGRFQLAEAHGVIGELAQQPCPQEIGVADAGGGIVDRIQPLHRKQSEADGTAKHGRKRKNDLAANGCAGKQLRHVNILLVGRLTRQRKRDRDTRAG